jgi:hypothetical protein
MSAPTKKINGLEFLALISILLISCDRSSSRDQAQSLQINPAKVQLYTQILFFSPNSDNEIIFKEFQDYLGVNGMSVRGTTLSLGMAAFEIESDNLPKLLKLMHSDRIASQRFRPLFDKDMSRKIYETESDSP